MPSGATAILRAPGNTTRRDHVSPSIEPNGNGQAAQAALSKVKLDLFEAEPSTIAPFTSSTISWEVTVPRGVDVEITIELNGTPVSTSGQLQVAPESTTSYSISAQAMSYSQTLGTITVQVDLTACIALSAEPVLVITDVIKYAIETNPSRLYFRSSSDPIVAIRGDRMIITLHLGKHLGTTFPNPTIDIDASFALEVVPIPPGGRGQGITSPFRHEFHQLAPANQSINTDVSFPWWAWLIPGAIIGLSIAETDAQDQAYGAAGDMITEIVQFLNVWFSQSYVQPPKMDKHDAGFYVNPQRDQRFWINFCPVPSPITEAS
jgi:hypothetical protein